jgi:hypothetical protein
MFAEKGKNYTHKPKKNVRRRVLEGVPGLFGVAQLMEEPAGGTDTLTHQNAPNAAGKHTVISPSFRARCNPIPELFISLFHISSNPIMQLSILVVRGGLLRIKMRRLRCPLRPIPFMSYLSPPASAAFNISIRCMK